jgi:hypothetical protein
VLTHFNTVNLSYVYGLYVANMINIFLSKTNDSKINSFCTQARAVDTCDKISRVYFLNVSICSLLLTLPPSAVGPMSILIVADTYITHSFDFTRWITGIDSKMNNYGSRSEWVVGLHGLAQKMEALTSSSLLYASEKQMRVAGIHQAL